MQRLGPHPRLAHRTSLPPPPRDPRHSVPGIDTGAVDLSSRWRCIPTPMKCVTWNVQGLRNPRCRRVVGRYLKEWGVDIISLQETMLTSSEQCIWSDLGWGGEATHVCIVANGRSGGVLLAWKAAIFTFETEWRGRHIAAARLVCQADDRHLVIASAYGPATPTTRGELWEDLTQLCRTFPNMPLLIGGDFNMTLIAADRPNNTGGLDPRSA